MDIFDFINFLWQRRKQIALILLFNAIFIVLVVLILPKKYTSTAQILPPQGNAFGSMISRYSSIASMLGVNVGVSEKFGPIHFESILKSRPILEQIILNQYETEKYPDKKVNLIQYFEVKGDTPQEKMEWCLDLMRNEIIAVRVNPENFITTLKVTTPEPQLSYAIANFLVNKLQKFNQKIIQKEALDKRNFLKKRLEEVRDSLNILEKSLINFLNQTVDITQPRIQVILNKKKRQIDIYSTLYMELRKQEELLRLQEFTELAPLKILEPPYIPALKSFPQRAIISILYMIGISVLLLAVYIVLFYKNKYYNQNTT